MSSGLEEQLQKAQQHAEQFKSMSEANESALHDLNKVRPLLKVVFFWVLQLISAHDKSWYLCHKATESWSC